jgi:hypothetical protein
VILIGLVACKPKHDNEWDPANPDKATLSGFVYGLNDQPIYNAEIMLLQDTFVCDTAWSGTDGAYEITEIDPGLYRLVAYAPHYLPFEHCELESLPADTIAEHDIWFSMQHYCFEEEPLGTAQPFGFDTVSGFWRVGEDPSGPENHSTPNVYHAERAAAGPALSLLKLSAPDFYLETKIRVLPGSDTFWLAGVVFRYQDPLNFYLVGIAHQGFGAYRRIAGVDYPLGAQPGPVLPGAWHSLTVEMHGPNIRVDFNGTVINCSDTHLTTGKAGLFVDALPPGDSVLVNFDDVYIGR